MLLQLDEYIWSCDLISAITNVQIQNLRFSSHCESFKVKIAKCVEAINTTVFPYTFSTYHGSTHKSEVDSGIELFDGVLQAGVSLRELGLGGGRVTLVAW